MRIEAYSQVQQLYNTKKTTRTSSAGSVSRKDALEISSKGKDFLAVKKAAMEAADIREEVTAPIKAQVQKGTYDVSPESFAEKLMAKYNARI